MKREEKGASEVDYRIGRLEGDMCGWMVSGVTMEVDEGHGDCGQTV